MEDETKTRHIIFADPDGVHNSFDLFAEFVEKMKNRNITGLSIAMNGKEYSYQVKDYQPKISNPNGELH